MKLAYRSSISQFFEKGIITEVLCGVIKKILTMIEWELENQQKQL